MTNALPLHQRIRSDIEARIRSGEWRPGFRIPFETELMIEYGCARMTVNKALSALVQSGLIVRRKRAGSFVARPKIHAPVLHIPDIPSTIRSRGEAYAFNVLSYEIRGPRHSEPDEVILAGAGNLLDIAGVHEAAGRPFALEMRLVSLVAAPDIAEVDLTQAPPGAWLLEHVAWTEAETKISAIAADGKTARRLQVDEGAACLVVDRRTWRNQEHVTQVRQVFPGETYDLVARFGPNA